MGDDGVMASVVEGTATLSTDARAISQETAARFLNELTRCISKPETMVA